MRIAVTYENGQIFQHFGHSESFKVYEAEGKNIVRAEVISTDGAGHTDRDMVHLQDFLIQQI